MDKCKYCSADAEFKCLVENDTPPGSHIEDVCSECINKPEIRAGLIEFWTKQEWLDTD